MKSLEVSYPLVSNSIPLRYVKPLKFTNEVLKKDAISKNWHISNTHFKQISTVKPLTPANHGCSWLGSSENYPTFWSLGSHRMLKTNFIHIVPYFRHPTRNPLTSRRGNQKMLTYPSALFDEATNLSVFVPFLAVHPFCIFPRLLKHISSRWSANRPRTADHHRQLYTLLTRQPTRLSTPFNLHPSPSFRKRVETGSTVWRCVCVWVVGQ